MIPVRCPHCQEASEIPESRFGEREICPVCGTTFKAGIEAQIHARVASGPARRIVADRPDLQPATIVRPTARQLVYLSQLGYRGRRPSTHDEASWLIDSLKPSVAPGQRSTDPERLRRLWVTEASREHVRQAKAELSADKQHRRDAELRPGETDNLCLAGWLIHMDPNCPQWRLNGLLIPLVGGKADWGLFPPYSDCGLYCECSAEPVTAEDMPPGTQSLARA
jgi:hypothetical protein